jgi:hypothetical protein
VFVAIETKAPGKAANVTPNQERVMHEIRLNDGFAFVVDSTDDLKLLFDSIDVFKKLN